MILVILFLILSSLLGFSILTNLGLKTRSPLLNLSLSAFIGQYATTWVVYLLAHLITNFKSNVLFNSTIVTIIFLIIVLSYLYLSRDILVNSILIFEQNKSSFINNSVFCFVSILFAYFFYSCHLDLREGVIYTSQIYWDFNVHSSIIQNFVYGDNFPPENESFSGAPMTYHFFFDLLTSIYSTFGLDLVRAINFTSILFFWLILLAIYGIASELYGGHIAGWIATIFTLTSSSLRFIYDLLTVNQVGLEKFKETHSWDNGYLFGFLPNSIAGYNGNLHNLFYFIAERQITLAVLILIILVIVLRNSKNLGTIQALLIGVGMGLFFKWHLFATISVSTAGFLYFLIKPDLRKKLFIIGSSLTLILAWYIWLHKGYLSSEWFLKEASEFPVINMRYSALSDDIYPLNFVNFIWFYVFAYGIKIPLLIASFYLLYKRNIELFKIFTCIIIPTFILTNTIQLSPLSVYDNHKWLRPLNAIIDLAAIYPLIIILQKLTLIRILAGLTLILLSTISGIIEFIPQIRSQPIIAYAQYPSAAMLEIRKSTPPKSTFLSRHAREVHLAGRKLFLGNDSDEPGATSVLESFRMDISSRYQLLEYIYSLNKLEEFCKIVKENKIDYVELSPNHEHLQIASLLANADRVKVSVNNGTLLEFVSTDSACR